MRNDLGSFAPVGNCIYCGASEGLSDEHIIPKGLKGTWILPKSSCEACRRITSRFETMCLRHLLGSFRRRTGFKSGKKQPLTVPQPIQRTDCVWENKEVPVGELPMAIALPRFDHLPLLLTGELKPLQVSFWAWIKHDAPDAVQKLGGIGFEIGEISPSDFTRMLAKIAHSYAVARFGIHAFRPLLRELIRYGSENPHFLIGGPSTHPPAEKFLHAITPRRVSLRGTNYLMLQIRLLAQLGAPAYFVLVGEFDEGSSLDAILPVDR